MSYIIVSEHHVFMNSVPKAETEEEAIAEAERLAGENPGTEYVVLVRVSGSRAEPPPKVVVPVVTNRGPARP